MLSEVEEVVANLEANRTPDKALDKNEVLYSVAIPGKTYWLNLRRNGLWHEEQKEGSVPYRIARPFCICASVRGFDSLHFGTRVQWETSDKKTVQYTILREDLVGDSVNLVKNLMSRAFPANLAVKSVKEDIISFFGQLKVNERAWIVDRIGWHEQNFCLPGKLYSTLNEKAGEAIYFLDETHTKYNQSGTLEEWQQHIGRLAQGNSMLTFAVACGFVGTLLRPLKEMGFGVHLFGKSGSGKSTCGYVVGSINGGPRFHETWLTTANAMEAMASSHDGTVLILDELGVADPKTVSNCVYALSNGQGKARLTQDSTSKDVRKWNLFYMSNGECTIEEKLAEARLTIRAGQETRLLNIPIRDHETCHEYTSNYAMAKAIEPLSQTYYGTPLDAFLTELVKLTPVDFEQLAEQKNQWLADTIPDELQNSQVRRAMEGFALIWLAGELASRWGISTLTSEQNEEAMRQITESWLQNRGCAPSGESRQAVTKLVAFIERNATRFEEVLPGLNCSMPVRDQAGFAFTSSSASRWDENGEPNADSGEIKSYGFFVGAWKEVFQGVNLKAVNQELVELGIIPDQKAQPLRGSTRKFHRQYMVDVRALQAAQGIH